MPARRTHADDSALHSILLLIFRLPGYAEISMFFSDLGPIGLREVGHDLRQCLNDHYRGAACKPLTGAPDPPQHNLPTLSSQSTTITR